MEQNELTLQQFAKQQIEEIETIKKEKEAAFKARNTTHFTEMAALTARQQPLKKLLTDYDNAKKGIIPAKMGRKPNP